MDIYSYIKKKGIPLATAAAELKVTRQALALWINGKRTPRPKHMTAIKKWSNGKVKPDDFYKGDD